MTATETTASRPSLWSRIGSLARRAVWMEIAGYVSIYRYVFRRPTVPPGARPFTYHRPVTLIFGVFIVGSAVEIVVVDLIARRWPAIRIPLLAIGIWGLIWMLGMLFGYLTRPHAVGPDGIRVRHGAEIDIPLRWDDLDEIALRTQPDDRFLPYVAASDDGTSTLMMPIHGQTTVHLVLARPRTVRLPQGRRTIHDVRMHVDEPQEFLRTAARYF